MRVKNGGEESRRGGGGGGMQNLGGLDERVGASATLASCTLVRNEGKNLPANRHVRSDPALSFLG